MSAADVIMPQAPYNRSIINTRVVGTGASMQQVADCPMLQRHFCCTTRLHFSLPIEGKVDCRGVQPMARRMRGSPFSQNKRLSNFNTIDSYEKILFKIHHFVQTLIPSSVTRVTFNLCIQTNSRVPPSPQWEGYQNNAFSSVGERLGAPDVVTPFLLHTASIISHTCRDRRPRRSDVVTPFSPHNMAIIPL